MSETRGVYRPDYEAVLAQQIQLAGLPRPVQQHKFHPIRRWKFDFAFPDYLLAVEVDGAVWTKGRHTRGGGFINDCQKLNEAALLGWRVLRFTPDMVQDGTALEYIRCALRAK